VNADARVSENRFYGLNDRLADPMTRALREDILCGDVELL